MIKRMKERKINNKMSNGKALAVCVRMDMSSSLPFTCHNKQYNSIVQLQGHHKSRLEDLLVCHCTYTLNVALTNIDCEGFSIIHFYLVSSILFIIIFYLSCISFVLQFHIDNAQGILLHNYVLILTLLFCFF